VPGIYFGKPRGFGTNDKGDDIGFNTEVYSATFYSQLHSETNCKIMSHKPWLTVLKIILKLTTYEHDKKNGKRTENRSRLYYCTNIFITALTYFSKCL
jgi:hypothetical protein